MANHYALIGRGISHSVSPVIYEVLSDKFDVEMTYEILDCSTLEEARGFIKSGKYKGFNVTTPYKTLLFDLIDNIDDTARKCVALNTISVEQGRVSAYNTDGLGFLDVLIARDYDINGKRVLIKGAGGAARSIAVQLLDAGAKNILLDTRSANTRLDFYTSINAQNDERIIMVYGTSALVVDLVINVTPVGTACENDLSIDLDNLSCEAVFDTVYIPYETALLKMAKEKEFKVFHGIDMLICQAVRAFLIWYPSVEVERIDAEFVNSISDALKQRRVL